MSEIATSQDSSPLLTNRPFLLLWTGQSLSLIGDFFFSTTIILWMIEELAKGKDWLPLATGGVAMSASLPSLLVGPIAGVFMDRWDRRWTMIWTDIIRFVLIMLFLLLTLFVIDRIMLLISSFGILLLVACGSQFFQPARVAIVADIVPQEQHVYAYGLLQQAGYLAQIAGPAVAAPLYIALGPTWAISLNAISFLLSFLLILLIRVPALERSKALERVGFWREFREGLHFFLSNRILVPLVISGMIFMFGGMAYNSLQYLYGSENLHIAEQLLGLFAGCYGFGMVIGLPVAAALAKRIGEAEVFWISLIFNGVAMLALSRLTTMIPGMICEFLSGMISAGIVVALRPLTALITPRELIGRVMAFQAPMITVASLAGGTIAGILASTVLLHWRVEAMGMTFGRLDTILVGIGLLTIGAGVFARLLLSPAVRAYRARSDQRRR